MPAGSKKYLKGYLDKIFVDEDVADLLRKDNMKKIASKLNEMRAGLELDIIGLAYLSDFHYDARYPGDDFYNVTKDDFEKCLSVMYDTVNKLRKELGDFPNRSLTSQ